MLWGLSPALDLLSEYEKVNSLFGKKTINVLLIGSTDGRHIIKTISALRRHSVDTSEVNFFVMDLATEFIARQLLLLTIALEPEDRLGIQEKARLWMEIYGNTLLRPVTAKYLMSKAVQLIHMVTNKDYQKKRLPLVDMDFVKYKEIDQLENIFKYWIRNRYSMVKIWDIKLRKSLGTRYDTREGVFDWDYNMKLQDIEGGKRVCASEYKLWRKIVVVEGTMFWGLSRAVDLIEEVKKVKEIATGSEINVLLIGSTDARHILKTVSQMKRHTEELKVNFFVLDSGEMLVRQMLLLAIALEPSEKLGPLEKSRIWMEVYGNTLLRSSTAKYVISKMIQLRLMITDKDFLRRRMALLDLSLLRYSDLDVLDEVAKYYQNNTKYPICRAWDDRLRTKMEEDYDYRFHHFDVDYCAGLYMIPGGHRVCKSEYIHWRNTGIAFTWLETEYSVGNPTLAVGVASSGDSLYSFGYMGDMESGPYFAFGTDSEEKPMLEVRNDVNVRRATDITERNLQRMFHELEHGSPPNDLYSASIDLGLVMMKPGNVDVEREVTLDYEPDRTPEDYSAIPVPNCKVYFLPGNAMDVFPKKAKYKEFFDITFVAQNFFKFLEKDILGMMKPSGCLVIETRKFVISLHKDTGAFGKKVRNKLHEFGWEEVKKCHFRKDDHALFRKCNGEPSNRNNSPEENETEYGNFADNPRPMGQAVTESIDEECSQLLLQDTRNISDSNLEELENSSSAFPGSTNVVEHEPTVNSPEVLSINEDTEKKVEDEKDTYVSEKDKLMISGWENQSDGALIEDVRNPEGQIQKTGSENKEIAKDAEGVNITDDDTNPMGQAVTKSILDSKDIRDPSNPNSEELKNTSFVYQKNAKIEEPEPPENGTNILLRRDVISITSLESSEFDHKEDANKKIKGEEDTCICERNEMMFFSGENQPDQTHLEDKRDPEKQIQESSSGDQEL